MSDEEIDALVVELKLAVADAGFRWILDDLAAQDAPLMDRRDEARALLDGIEAATIELGLIERRARETLGVDAIEFKLDVATSDAAFDVTPAAFDKGSRAESWHTLDELSAAIEAARERVRDGSV